MSPLQSAAVAVLFAYERVHDQVDDPQLADAMHRLERALPASARRAFEATLEAQANESGDQ